MLVAGVRWASRGKDAGSVRSRRLRARPRTQQPASPADERKRGVAAPSAALRHSHCSAKPSYSACGWVRPQGSQSWPNARMASMMGRSDSPFSVREYSTRGGVSG